jgi:opacity protein-like surface antigen
LLVCLLAAPVAFAQNLSFGVKGGVPLANSLKVTDPATYTSNKSAFVLGPAFELRLPLGLGAEADLLYRRLQYTSAAISRTGIAQSSSTGQAWEVPLLAKYRVPGVLLRPYVAAGYSFRRVAQLPLNGPFTMGPTLGGGLELRVPLVRFSAELRYTRWGSSSFKAALGGLATQLNQADLLLGIMF